MPGADWSVRRADALKNLEGLKNLRLYAFQVTGKGMEAFTASIAVHNTSLQALALVACGLKAAAKYYKPLAAALPQLTGLTSLHLQEVDMFLQDGQEYAAALVPGLMKLQNLRVLDMAGHAASTCTAPLVTALSAHPALRRVVLDSGSCQFDQNYPCLVLQ